VKSVLIVEDNPLNRELTRFILSTAGYEVLQAESAEEGLNLARERRPAVVLLDIHLPGMDGVAAAQLLRADPVTSGAKLLAITASAMKGDRERIMAGTFDGYISKPFRPQELLDAVKLAGG
jgi:two-component system cell cycle response regulator DivK